MRIIFLGTPTFAVHPLRALAADPRFELVGVVTQPDRPAGRTGTALPPPVKVAAQALGLTVLQPPTLKDPAVVAALAALRPDIGVVAAYGEILRRDVLTLPALGYVNIHPSLLPLHRGPTPVVGAILAGDDAIGISIMLLEARMDAGPLLRQERLPLAADARAGALNDALFIRGAQLLTEVLPAYAAGQLLPVPQHHELATYTKLLRKQDGAIDWGMPARQIERMSRAYDPWPGAMCFWRGQPFKIIAATVGDAAPAAPLGALVDTDAGVAVVTGDRLLTLVTVQPAGKRPVSAVDWRRGLHNLATERLA
jgi:methionyl-tRNA formyltransferase